MLVSVIVPVYKVEKYIHRCVDSILNQTFRDFELILVDDGSPDSCGAICEEYAAKDSRIHVIHRENGGLSAARNSGIEWALENSHSQYLTFIDSDDWIHPQYLQLLVTGVQEGNVDVSIGFHKYSQAYSADALAEVEKPEIAVMSPEDLLIDHPWNYNYAWSKLYRKNLFQTLRYPEGKNFEDTFTTYQALFAAGRVALVKQEIYFYFRNAQGITRSPWNEKELVIFEGMQAQLAFYRANGHLRAYEAEEKLYVNHFAYQLTRIRENKADWQKNKPIWCRLRREMLALMKESHGKYTFKTMPQCFAAAYPRLTAAQKLGNRLVNAWKRYGFGGIVKKIREKLGG